MAYCQLPMETGWNTMEPREGNVWTSLNMAPSQRITLESPMNLVRHIKSSPLKRFKRLFKLLHSAARAGCEMKKLQEQYLCTSSMERVHNRLAVSLEGKKSILYNYRICVGSVEV